MNSNLLVLDLSVISKGVLAVRLDEETWEYYADAYEKNKIKLYGFINNLAKEHKGKSLKEIKEIANEIKPVPKTYEFIKKIKDKGYDIALITKDYSILAEKFKKLLSVEYAFGSVPIFSNNTHTGEMKYIMDEKGILDAIESIKDNYKKIITIADDRAYKILDKISEIIVYDGKDNEIKNTSYKHVDSPNILDLLKYL